MPEQALRLGGSTGRGGEWSEKEKEGGRKNERRHTERERGRERQREKGSARTENEK